MASDLDELRRLADDADAAFIAASRNAVPDLLAEVTSLRAQIAAVRALHVKSGGPEEWMGDDADWLALDPICGWCTYDDRTVPWPCPTVAALGGEPT